MEHKLVEKAKKMLEKGDTEVSLIHQYHDKEHGHHQSGMICSGSQVIAIVPLGSSQVEVVSKIQAAAVSENCLVGISPQGLTFSDRGTPVYLFKDAVHWSYSEWILNKKIVHIIGGGHVSRALSECLHFLDYHVKVYDDRKDLNTLEENPFADEKIYVDYQHISDRLCLQPDQIVLIMTIGYRTDKIVLKQLLGASINYLGLLGSSKKIKTLFEELLSEGEDPALLEKVYAPVGLDISSKTSNEIAISIAAEIIREKNKAFPSRRATQD